MRPLESYAIYLSLYLIWHDTARGATPLTALLLLVTLAHLWLERPRWQLTLLYIHTVYLVNAVLLWNIQGTSAVSVSSWTSVISSFGVIMVTAALACLFPVARFPALQGKFKAIGVVQRLLPTSFAAKRHEDTKSLWALPAGIQGAQRYSSLGLSVFYPASHQVHPQEASRGLQFLSSAALNGLATFLNMPKMLFSYVSLARIRAVPDIPIAPISTSQAKLPVVLFSHGLGGTATMYSAQVCELASQGYVVFALTHNDGSSALAELDNDVLVTHRSTPGSYGDPLVTIMRREQVLTRVSELSLVLDAIFEAEETGVWPFSNPFAGRLDLTRIGLMGHSFGAATVTLMASKETRVKAVVAHDLWVLPLSELVQSGGIRGPPLLVTQSEEWTHWQANAEGTTALTRASRDAHLLQILGTHHSNYSDVPLFSEVLSRKMRAIGEIDFKQGLRCVNALSLEFLQRHLGSTSTVDGTVSAPAILDAPMFEHMLQKRHVVMLAQSKQ